MVVARVRVIAEASRLGVTLVVSPLPISLAQWTQSWIPTWKDIGSLAIMALPTEPEDEKPGTEEVPGRIGEERTIVAIDALRRDEAASVPNCLYPRGGRVDARTLLEEVFDIVPPLTFDLNPWIMAVELNPRDCALPRAKDESRRASARRAALESLLLEATGGWVSQAPSAPRGRVGMVTGKGPRANVH
jgi:hypothetical protein